MTIAVPTGRTRTGAALEGRAPERQSRRLAWLTVAAFWMVTAVAGALTWVAHRRNLTWARALTSGDATDIDAANHAAHQTLLLSRLGWGVTGIAALALAAWSHALARNARARGVASARPGRTAVTWFVPVVGPPAAIRELSRLVREFDYSDRRLGFWLFGIYVHTTVMLLGQLVDVIAFNVSIDDGWAATTLHRQSQLMALETLMGAIVATLATRAIAHADTAVSGERHAAIVGATELQAA